jgi:hypothetical protein
MMNWLTKRTQQSKFKRYYFAEMPIDLSKVGEFRGEQFPESGPVPWLDRPDALEVIDRKLKSGEISEADAELCFQWTTDGYIAVPKLIDQELLDEVWTAYEAAIDEGLIQVRAERIGPDDVHPGRHLDTHLVLPVVRKIQQHPRVIAITDLLFGRKTWPFQTIMGHKGSSQKPHSDSVHMTTYPKGYMLANWIAFEDIHENSGPLEYYPRSHRLVPDLLSSDIGIDPLEFKNGGGVYSGRYEPAVRRYIDAMDLKPSYFTGKAGGVLFWHARLLHGGSKRKDHSLSRKALVCHYFAEGSVTYHDLSGNPSRIHRNGMYEEPTIEWL